MDTRKIATENRLVQWTQRLQPEAQPCEDTGMGWRRVLAIFQEAGERALSLAR